MGLLKKNTMLVGGMLLLGLGTANAENEREILRSKNR